MIKVIDPLSTTYECGVDFNDGQSEISIDAALELGMLDLGQLIDIQDAGRVSY